MKMRWTIVCVAKRSDEGKTKLTKQFLLQPRRLHQFNLISATGLVEMRKNCSFQWLESRCLTVSRDALTCCDIRILVKPHGSTLLTLMTRMAHVFKMRQQCQILCQACIFALVWMNQQHDYDLPNKTWLDCCKAACEHLNPCGNEAATSGETIQRWNRQFQKLDKFQHPNRTVAWGQKSRAKFIRKKMRQRHQERLFRDGTDNFKSWTNFSTRIGQCMGAKVQSQVHSNTCPSRRMLA
jgi:hypothetical protein